MTEEPPIQRMQQIALYRTTCKHLRRTGIVAILAGVACLIDGALAFNGRVADWIYMGVSALEIYVGMHNRLRPTLAGYIAEGWLLFVLGGYVFITLAFGMGRAGGLPLLHTPGFAVFAIGASSLYLSRYRRVREAFLTPPTADQLSWLNEVVVEILALRQSGSPEVVGFTAGNRKWAARRFGDMMIIVDQSDSITSILDCRIVYCTDKGRALFRSYHHVDLLTDDLRIMQAQFAPEMLARLESWLPEENFCKPPPKHRPARAEQANREVE